MHDARSVANELISRANETGKSITPLQAIKLTYYCHAWMLAFHDRPLVEDSVEAWQYGPVISSVYHSLKRYGKGPIDFEIGVRDEKYDRDERGVIDLIYEHYGELSGLQLSAMTHKPGTPWYQVWTSHGREEWDMWRTNAVIPNSIIMKYYKEVAEARASESAGAHG